ncbi:hypothetical protein [Legionella shakespearei]|uniref:Uncharacterized protein n=1 Tax=Legionella shakespearei DSM 23087 TaxID=1122169 RepID=A0A0W0Z7I9_9GAMM|nr:hypothetical protein [Legionella shakespearei]KTD65082.1 hypothetical protein Lsha_0451 [Legionella shakespearei DSM 23087]
MKHIRKYMGLIARGLIFSSCLNYAPHSFSCDYYPENRGLGGRTHPDFPMNKYLAGHLGVISPQYHMSYLIIAYRYLSKNPLSRAEQQDALDAYLSFFAGLSDDYYPMTANEREGIWFKYAPPREPLRWHYASLYPSPVLEFITLLNQPVTDDASHTYERFGFATLRLHTIVNELSQSTLSTEEQREIIMLWIAAQKKLFRNDTLDLNADLNAIPTHALPLLQADIKYMRAAIYFNSDEKLDLLQSAELFAPLAQQDDYPWHELAQYLIYRAFTRAACMDAEYPNYIPRDHELLKKALSGMQQLADNAQDLRVKQDAINYRNIIKGRLDIRGRLVEIARQTEQKISNPEFSDLIFYNQNVNWRDVFADDSELAEWLSAYLSKNAEKTFPNAYARWDKNRDNMAWLLVALNTIQVANPEQRNELFKAAAQVQPANPGFFSIRAAWINATLTENKTSSFGRQRQLINSTLAALQPGEDFATSMYFLNFGLQLSENIEQLLSYGFFVPSASMVSLYPAIETTPYPFYSHSAFSQTLNKLPLSVLTQIAESKRIPKLARPQLYASIWARATLLGKFAIADAVAAETIKLNPALTTTIKASRKTKNQDERYRLFVNALLHYPELNPIINLRNTWNPVLDDDELTYRIEPRIVAGKYHEWPYWCANLTRTREMKYDEDVNENVNRVLLQTPIAKLLTSAQQKEWVKEQEQINSLPDGAQWIADTTARLARKHHKDQRYAELLGLSVRATRIVACYNSSSFASQRAFAALHRFYPESEWAKRTKYYY